MRLRATIFLVFSLLIVHLKAQDSTKSVIIKIDPIRWLYKLSVGAEFYKNSISLGTNFSRYNFHTSSESLASPLTYKCDIYIRKYSYSKKPYGFYVEGKLSILHHKTFLEEEYYDVFNYYDHNNLPQSTTTLRSSKTTENSPISLGGGIALGWQMTGNRVSWDFGFGLQVIPLKASKKITYNDNYEYDLNGNLTSQYSSSDETKYTDQITFSYLIGPTAIYNVHFMLGYKISR